MFLGWQVLIEILLALVGVLPLASWPAWSIPLLESLVLVAAAWSLAHVGVPRGAPRAIWLPIALASTTYALFFAGIGIATRYTAVLVPAVVFLVVPAAVAFVEGRRVARPGT